MRSRNTVNLRMAVEKCESKKAKVKPESEWLLIHNTHEAIVDQEIYDLVQKLRELPRRIDMLGEANPLTGYSFVPTV